MATVRWMAPLFAAVLALAGCSSPSHGHPNDAPATTAGGAAADADFSALDLQATKTTGILRGLVVDAAVRPITGANVTVNPGALSGVSDSAGRFGFEGLEPGSYAVRAEAKDHIVQQVTVEVAAGDDDPRPIVLSLAAVPGTEPYAEAYAWDGFMQCSLIAAGFFFTGCMASDYTEDNSRKEDAVSLVPDFMQSELQWDSTQTLGDNLCMKHYARGAAGGTDFEPITDTQGRSSEACGNVPVVQSFNRTQLNDTRVGVDRGIERVVWVDYAVDGALGVAMNQQFTVFTHVFHHFVPPDGWAFGKDGSPTPP